MLCTLTNFLVLCAFTWPTNADGFDLNGISDNQVYFSKAPRFIKFDSKDDEVEIELGVSIPVVKVPLSPPVGRAGKKKESGITVSPPGLVVAGVLMLTTFLVVPLLFSKKMYRTGKTEEVDHVWSLVKQIENGFYDSFVEKSSCVENLICWSAKASNDGKEGEEKWMNEIMRSKWLTRLLNGTFVEKAIRVGTSDSSCMDTYNNCPMLEKLYKRMERLTTTKNQT